MRKKCRSPSSAVAKAALAKKAQKLNLKADAEKAVAACKKAGGYGKLVVSIWEAPKGGIEKSPAYRKLLTRCEVDKKGKPPIPEQRDGAPVKGGFPLKKYPPNVIVDGMRAPWLPDSWAQVIKNTGPGGVYLGWMSPEGKFFYHRDHYPTSIEGTLGRRLTLFDGMNGVMRNVRKIVKPGADKEFLRDCLSASERKHIVSANGFHFAVVSARRATNESGQHDILTVEGLFKQAGIKPTWYVDEASLEDYRKMGVAAKVGGKLTPARNMALDDAKKSKRVCVQVSDDISRWIYYDCEKQNFKGETSFKKANAALNGIKRHVISPLAAAQFILAKMRADPDRPHLGGIFPTSNVAMTLGSQEFGKQHFILGDFFVAEPSSPCRFDTHMTLKEDYDYTCSHLKEHGSVLRCNRMFIHVKHSTNAGGAVASRDSAGAKEKQNIKVLQDKWPGVFRLNGRRKDAQTEVTMHWGGFGKAKQDGKKEINLTTKGAKKVKQHMVKGAKKATANSVPFPSTAILRYTDKAATAEYITKRCRRCHSKSVGTCLGMKYNDDSGIERTYSTSDLRYDLASGRLQIKKR